MKSLHQWSEQETTYETDRLVKEVENRVGEDNAVPWLLVHQTLVQAAARGYKIGLKAAVVRAHEQRN